MVDVRIDYDMMVDMAQAFRQASQQLEDTLREMQNIATTLENGALLGRAGDSLTEGIRGRLCPAIDRLREKNDELTRDIYGAISDFRGADFDAESLFGN